jgi:RNA-directed DNA polymerase
MWRQWKTARCCRAAQIELGVRGRLVCNTTNSGLGPWHLAKSEALSVGLSNTSRTAVYEPVRTVARQGSAGDRCPYADQFALGAAAPSMLK